MNKRYFQVKFLLPYLVGDAYRKIGDVHSNGKRYPLALELLKSKKVVNLIRRIEQLSQISKKFRDAVKVNITSNIHYELYLWMLYSSDMYLDMWKILYDNRIVTELFSLSFDYTHSVKGCILRSEFKTLKYDEKHIVLRVEITRDELLVNSYSLWCDNKTGQHIVSGNVTKIDKLPRNIGTEDYANNSLLLSNQLRLHIVKQKRVLQYIDRVLKNKNNLSHVIDLLDILIELLSSD
jgi:hypothetical protein